jgi:hypothetical protein
VILRDLAVTLVVFAAASVLALALGAANLGTALAFGQIGFVAALTYVLVRR